MSDRRRRRRRRRPRSRAVAHFERTGLILPGAQGEIAGYLADRKRGGQP